MRDGAEEGRRRNDLVNELQRTNNAAKSVGEMKIYENLTEVNTATVRWRQHRV